MLRSLRCISSGSSTLRTLRGMPARRTVRLPSRQLIHKLAQAGDVCVPQLLKHSRAHLELHQGVTTAISSDSAE